MENLIAPFLCSRTEMENREAFGSLQAQFAVQGFRRFDRGERNLQPELAAKENFARFEQSRPFRPLLAKLYLAIRFVSHGGSPLFLPICSGNVTLRRWASPVEGPHDSKLIPSMATATTNTVDWKLIWAQRGFRFFFLAMFVSLFGSVMTLPGLFIPFFGGVLIDRIDRRYLGVLLDLVRGCFVLATAYIAWHGQLQLWHLYAMTLITGTGSAMYWATVNALVQEVIPSSQFTGANAAVLVGVQSGMLIAGAFVGFLYNTAGIAGILAIDGATYFVSAYCLYQVRRGYVSPRESQKYPREYSEATEATAEALETGVNPEVAEAGLSLAIYADMKEGFAYLKQQPLVLALGITHAIVMAGVVSANVVLVALANDILHAGPRGLGFLEAGWAIGAIVGGLIASQLPQSLRMPLYVVACAGLAVGHMATPFVAFLVG